MSLLRRFIKDSGGHITEDQDRFEKRNAIGFNQWTGVSGRSSQSQVGGGKKLPPAKFKEQQQGRQVREKNREYNETNKDKEEDDTTSEHQV